MSDGPRRIVCLTEEPTEILYRLGEESRIVGISAYTVRPPAAARDKPVVSAFVQGSVAKIDALRPDLVIGFSDVQANLARDLIHAGLPVLIFNQRSIAEILDVVLTLGRIVGAEGRARALLAELEGNLDRARQAATRLPRRPRVYFEEWPDPRISAIRWVSELIEIAGGEDVFADRRDQAASKGRQVTDDEILRRAPEIFVGCWCGKAVDLGEVRGREGWDALPCVRDDRLVEMDPAIILQPGPAALGDGIARLQELIAETAAGTAQRE